MKRTTFQQISLGRATSLDKNFVRMRRLKNKAALTAGASKQISAYATSCFEARTTNRIKNSSCLAAPLARLPCVSKSVSDQVKVISLKSTIHKHIENNPAPSFKKRSCCITWQEHSAKHCTLVNQIFVYPKTH